VIKKKPTKAQKTAQDIAEIRGQLGQIAQSMSQLGHAIRDNQLQNAVFARVLMTRINELSPGAITRETYVETSTEYQIARARPDWADIADAWLSGKEIPEAPEAETPSDEAEATPVEDAAVVDGAPVETPALAV